MNSSICYNGKVTLKIKGKPPIKKKNKGTEALFKLMLDIFTKALVSDPRDLDKRLPNYISVLKNYQTSNTEEILVQPCAIVSRNKSQEDNNFTVIYDAFLSSYNIKSFPDDIDTLYFVLCDYDKTILAFAQLDDTDIESLLSMSTSAGVAQAKITWELNFSNNKETTINE